MFCVRCGAPNDDSAKFCTTCGAPLAAAGPMGTPSPAPEFTPQPAPEPEAQPTPEPAPAAPEAQVIPEPVAPVSPEAQPTPEPAPEPEPVAEPTPFAAPEPEPAAPAPEQPAQPAPWASQDQPAQTASQPSMPEQPAPWAPQGQPAQPEQPAPWAPQDQPTQPAPWASQSQQPQQPPASWPDQPQQPPTFEQQGSKGNTGKIIAIVAGCIAVLAVVAIALFALGIGKPADDASSTSSSSEPATQEEQPREEPQDSQGAVTTSPADVTMPDYCGPTYYNGKSLADIRTQLEGLGLEIASVYGYESGSCDVSFSGTPASMPSNAREADMFITVGLDTPNDADLSYVESIDQVPADATVSRVNISYTTNIAEADYIAQVLGVTQAFGLTGTDYGTASTQELLDAAVEAFGFESDQGYLNDAEQYDFEFSELTVSGPCDFYGAEGGWYVSVSNYGYGTDMYISYNAPY